MKKAWRLKMAYLSALVLTIIGVVLSYQNCGQAPVGTTVNTSGSPTPTGTVTDPIGDAAPFAFTLVPDQITYMSCTTPCLPPNPSCSTPARNAPANSDQYFTFRVGAFGDNGGIKLNDDFISYAKSSLKIQRYKNPVTGRVETASRILPSQIVDLLQRSKYNQSAQIQLAIRQFGYLNTNIVSATSSPVLGKDYSNLWQSLTSDRFVKAVVDKSINDNQALHFMSDGSGLLDRQFNVAIRFMELGDPYTGPENQLRDKLSNEYALALTFLAAGSSSYNARSPYDYSGSAESAKTSVYGVGYKFNFTSPITNVPERAVQSVSEQDLTQGYNPASWDCNSVQPYQIVDPMDAMTASNSLCPPISDQENINAGGSQAEAELKTIRRHLLAEYWYVNVAKKCVVPKHSDKSINLCYRPRDTITDQWIKFENATAAVKLKDVPIVEYAPTSSSPCNQYHKYFLCNNNGSICGAAQGTSSFYKECPHYVSFCVRNN